MGDWFLGEIRIFPYDYAPTGGWVDCDGRLLNIYQYQALFALIGNAFGGNGTSTFALPDLRGRVAVHPNTVTGDPTRIIINRGELDGKESHALTAAEVASHTHLPAASNVIGTSNAISTTVGTTATGNYWAAGNTTTTGQQHLYGAPPADPQQRVAMANCVKSAGGGHGHPNVQPFQTLRYCIATMGIFPSRQ